MTLEIGLYPKCLVIVTRQLAYKKEKAYLDKLQADKKKQQLESQSSLAERKEIQKKIEQLAIA